MICNLTLSTMQGKLRAEAKPEATKIDHKFDQKTFLGGTHGIQNRPKIAPGSRSGHPRSAQGPPEFTTAPPGRPRRAQRAPKRASPEPLGSPKITPSDLRERPRAKKTRTCSVFTPKKWPFRFSIAFSSIFGRFLKVPTLVSCGQGHTKATFPFFAKVAKKVAKSRARTSENRPKIDKNRPKVAPGGPRAPTATQKRRATGNRRRATGTGSVPSRKNPNLRPQGSCQVSRARFPFIKADI